MKHLQFFVLFFLFTFFAKAQFIKDKSLSIQLGYGLTAPYDSQTSVVSNGYFVQGELIYKVTNWVALKPYAGFIFTNFNGEDLDGNPSDELAETKAFFFGGKTRLRVPIPYVAPFLEVGFGASIGSFITDTFFDFYDKDGIIYHIPISFGLELGKNHGVTLGLSYLLHNSIEQQAGAPAVGITFPLK